MQDKGYEVLMVSQFTLHSRLNGNKLDFSKAMKPVEVKDSACKLNTLFSFNFNLRPWQEGQSGEFKQCARQDLAVSFLVDWKDDLFGTGRRVI